MQKRVLPFIVISALFIVSSCMSATTPQDRYATEMQPALELLATWQNDYTNLETLFTDPLDASSDITRSQLIELYNIATTEYKITRDDYSKLGLIPLDALVGPSVNLSKDGKVILEILTAATPVAEIQADHQAVLDCVQTRIAFADELSSSIKDLSEIDMNKVDDLVGCEPFDTSLEKLTAFVNENK